MTPDQFEDLSTVLWAIRDELKRIGDVHERNEARDAEMMAKSEARLEESLRNQADMIAVQQEIAEAHTSAANRRNQ